MPRTLRKCELRAEGRRLVGTVLHFADVSPTHRERFLPGAFTFARSVPLNLEHDALKAIAWQPDGGLSLRQDRDALTMVAELPPIPAADRALAMVRDGMASGLSVEFRSEAERREAGLRVVEKALLTGIGLVRRPSYTASQVEARARSGRKMRARIPYNEELACECIAQAGPGTGGQCVPMVMFQEHALQAMADVINGAVDQARREVLAVYKDYSRPLASARKGTLRAEVGDIEDGLIVSIDIPTGEAGDMVQAASEAAGVIVRPLIDYARSEFTDTDRGRVVTKPFLRALLVGATDAREGWPDARIDYEPEDDLPALPPPRQRRGRLWL